MFCRGIAAGAPERLHPLASSSVSLSDLPEAEQKLVYATQGVPVADLFSQKIEGTAWKTKPSWYIVGTQDRTVNPELQRFAAKRMKAATTEVTSSHVPMLSKPDVVLDVIRKAASAVPAP